jgi:hypothetical protein
MTTHEHSDDGGRSGGAAIDRDLIARELAVLGESPPDGSELDWASTYGQDDGDEEVATTRALFRVAASHPGTSEALSPIETRRVWKRLAGRLEPLHAKRAERMGGGGTDTGRRMFAVLAMAAAVVLVTRLAMVGQAPASVSGDESRALTEALGEQARASLHHLGGEVDGARARALADSYATRLRTDREGT